MNEGALELVPERRACFSCKAEMWQPTTTWTKMQSRKVREEMWMEPTNKPFLSQNLVLIAWLHSILRHEKCWSQKKKKKKISAKVSKFCKFSNIHKERITREAYEGSKLRWSWRAAGCWEFWNNDQPPTPPNQAAEPTKWLWSHAFTHCKMSVLLENLWIYNGIWKMEFVL